MDYVHNINFFLVSSTQLLCVFCAWKQLLSQYKERFLANDSNLVNAASENSMVSPNNEEIQEFIVTGLILTYIHI